MSTSCAVTRRRTPNVLTLPAEYGYVGVILITAFSYTLLRLRFIFVVLVTVFGIIAYLPYAFAWSFRLWKLNPCGAAVDCPPST